MDRLTCPPDVAVRLHEVTVEIPLRGVKRLGNLGDPRIFRRNGQLFLRALDRVSLVVRRGERIGIVGGNGNGKTTLLKVISGLLPAASGTVEVRGTLMSLLSLGAGTFPALTGRQNVHLRYALLGIATMSLSAYVDDVERFSQLGAFFDLPVGSYSPGMQSRLQFAMHTAEPGDILLLDEWLGVADEAFQHRAHDRLVEYIKSNEALIFASHSQELLGAMTDRRLRLEMGQVIEG